MINITSNDLEKLEPLKLGSGAFGKIYKLNNKELVKIK